MGQLKPAEKKMILIALCYTYFKSPWSIYHFLRIALLGLYFTFEHFPERHLFQLFYQCEQNFPYFSFVM